MTLNIWPVRWYKCNCHRNKQSRACYTSASSGRFGVYWALFLLTRPSITPSCSTEGTFITWGAGAGRCKSLLWRKTTPCNMYHVPVYPISSKFSELAPDPKPQIWNHNILVWKVPNRLLWEDFISVSKIFFSKNWDKIHFFLNFFLVWLHFDLF